ncbi:unnamed protein product [marine sediment metagenome]|uniref:Uncharacterized protein n=1 Tax=marine sediment metagenome TaxID=412755 RepID=X1M3J2_9ZZZZ
MTASLPGWEVAQQITELFPDVLIEASDASIVINSESLLSVAAFLKDTAGLDFDYLTSITAVEQPCSLALSL